MANRFILNEVSYHGKGAINEIPGEIKGRGFKKALIVTGKSLCKHGVVAKVTDLLDKDNLEYEIFNDVEPNPSVKTVKAGLHNSYRWGFTNRYCKRNRNDSKQPRI